jgi:hypothetical protein
LSTGAGGSGPVALCFNGQARGGRHQLTQNVTDGYVYLVPSEVCVSPSTVDLSSYDKEAPDQQCWRREGILTDSPVPAARSTAVPINTQTPSSTRVPKTTRARVLCFDSCRCPREDIYLRYGRPPASKVLVVFSPYYKTPRGRGGCLWRRSHIVLRLGGPFLASDGDVGEAFGTDVVLLNPVSTLKAHMSASHAGGGTFVCERCAEPPCALLSEHSDIITKLGGVLLAVYALLGGGGKKLIPMNWLLNTSPMMARCAIAVGARAGTLKNKQVRGERELGELGELVLGLGCGKGGGGGGGEEEEEDGGNDQVTHLRALPFSLSLSLSLPLSFVISLFLSFPLSLSLSHKHVTQIYVMSVCECRFHFRILRISRRT